MLGTILLDFLDSCLVAACSENAEGSEDGTDEQCALEATDKGMLQTDDTCEGKALCLRR